MALALRRLRLLPLPLLNLLPLSLRLLLLQPSLPRLLRPRDRLILHDCPLRFFRRCCCISCVCVLVLIVGG